MKKHILLILLPIIFQGQTFRAYYCFNYKPNKIDTIRAKKNQILIFDNEKSVFQDYKYMKMDSIFIKNRDLWKQFFTSNNAEDSMTDFQTIITNNLKTGKITYKSLMINTYEYSETINFQWKLENKFQNIHNITCQKATTKFGGRFWEAWFSNDYPFFFGPYKFHGLPGLIVKLSDSERNFIWELSELKQQDNDDFYDKNLSEIQGLSSKKLDKKKFVKLEKQMRVHPLGNVTEYTKDISLEELKKVREIESRLAKQNQYLDNTIEID